MRPSDVIRHYGGRTSEVGNTDAEGRLVLADALAYAVPRLRPDAIVDIATLTGAMMVALGTRIGGILSNSDQLSAAPETLVQKVPSFSLRGPNSGLVFASASSRAS